MANSRSRFSLGFDPNASASRTPGVLGLNDAASPNACCRGDSPGPLGINDHASPEASRTPGSESLPEKAKRISILTPSMGADVKLTAEDYQRAAAALGGDVSVAIIKAFAEVESGGKSGFGDNRLPVIAFEGHIFRRYTHKKYDYSHPLLSYRYIRKAGPEWQQNNRSHAAAWKTLDDAMKLDLAAALQASSWGMFQVMGFNFAACGYKTVESFVEAMKLGESGQLDAFVGYCKRKTGLIQAMREKSFQTMARLYNGEDYGNYDVLIAKKYNKYIGT
ncbi:N-acetylmuramidase family protein [Geomonas sp. RF6]|uniref:N-acetylmuramidase family protein n=1 Tax=Geomonas sp. RF6 TaxID=2897342 RepID=UPI001E3F15A6|nr:N-acetylmuramidase family protein [Geomonas sp. RF6]UFS70702.1 N-acetylmuramidase family protein [Geomonas sp. RF6]